MGRGEGESGEAKICKKIFTVYLTKKRQETTTISLMVVVS
jgi:hypothetical protein